MKRISLLHTDFDALSIDPFKAGFDLEHITGIKPARSVETIRDYHGKEYSLPHHMTHP